MVRNGSSVFHAFIVFCLFALDICFESSHVCVKKTNWPRVDMGGDTLSQTHTANNHANVSRANERE